MAQYDVNSVIQAIRKMEAIVELYESDLTTIDSLNGDGDLGTSMRKGFGSILAEAENYHAADIGVMLGKCGMAFNRAAPSTMGTLLGMAMVKLGNVWKGKAEISDSDVVEAPAKIVEAIASLGKARVGDKTILDALVPFAEVLKAEYEVNADLAQSTVKALEACRQGLESTKGMVASVGRARWLGERANQNYDGGAFFCYRLLNGLVQDETKTQKGCVIP